MKHYLSALLAGLLVATFSAPAAAMPSGTVMEEVPGVYPMDCTKWKDKARCAALNRTIEACRNKTDDEWRVCMQFPEATGKFTPPKPRDCSTARHKERCEAHVRALAACKDVLTPHEHRQCVAGHMQDLAAKQP